MKTKKRRKGRQTNKNLKLNYTGFKCCCTERAAISRLYIGSNRCHGLDIMKLTIWAIL